MFPVNPRSLRSGAHRYTRIQSAWVVEPGPAWVVEPGAAWVVEPGPHSSADFWALNLDPYSYRSDPDNFLS